MKRVLRIAVALLALLAYANAALLSIGWHGPVGGCCGAGPAVACHHTSGPQGHAHSCPFPHHEHGSPQQDGNRPGSPGPSESGPSESGHDCSVCEFLTQAVDPAVVWVALVHVAPLTETPSVTLPAPTVSELVAASPRGPPVGV